VEIGLKYNWWGSTLLRSYLDAFARVSHRVYRSILDVRCVQVHGERERVQRKEVDWIRFAVIGEDALSKVSSSRVLENVLGSFVRPVIMEMTAGIWR
jgi:hypothetical protein